MPLKINLLAEAQEAEELRRKDPVRRAIWIAGFCVLAVCAWMLELQLDIYFAKSDGRRSEKRIAAIKSTYTQISSDQTKTSQTDQKLAALRRFTTNRFLWAPLLNSLQKTVTDDIQVIRLSGNQRCFKENTHAAGSRLIKKKAPRATVESISLSIEALDMSSDKKGFNRYKNSLDSCDYFVRKLKRRDGFILEAVLDAPAAISSNVPGNSVMFKLNANFPEARRNE